MSFIPVYLSTPHAPTAQADRSHALALPPAPGSMPAAQPGKIADTPPAAIVTTSVIALASSKCREVLGQQARQGV